MNNSYALTFSLALASLAAIRCGGLATAPEAQENIPSRRVPGIIAQARSNSCSAYNSVTAAIADATVACLGRVGTFDYQVIDSGFNRRLKRKFDICGRDVSPDQSMRLLGQIDRLLAVQDQMLAIDPTSIPDAPTCIADGYATAQEQVARLGNFVCPNLHKQFVANTPTPANVARITSLLPKPVMLNTTPPKLGFPRGSFGPKSRMPVSFAFYTASYGEIDPGHAHSSQQSCGRIDDCVKACASVFPGFYVGRFGNTIVADPPWWNDPPPPPPRWWEDPTVYSFDPHSVSPPPSPYLRDFGFYHPMAEYGGEPGVIFGAYERGISRSDLLANPNLSYEECTYWTEYGSLIGRLVPWPPNYKDVSPRTWLSKCEPL